MLRIGITGGIGSGKSVVCKYFERMQVPVYHADDTAKVIIDTDPGIRKEIIAFFGASAYTKKGLNRPFIRKKVFEDKESLSKLNAITHPPVLAHFALWCNEMKKQKHPFVIKEAALIFEIKSYTTLDFTVCVIAPLETRIARVMRRDGKTREEVENIIKKQMSDEEKIKLANWVINNPDDELVLPQIVALHQLIINKSLTHGN
jgi:dephospho-CoA kinase